MTQGSPFIAFEKVQKIYGEGAGRVCALAGVDLAIARGEFLAIMKYRSVAGTARTSGSGPRSRLALE